jgi:hypothetical protein
MACLRWTASRVSTDVHCEAQFFRPHQIGSRFRTRTASLRLATLPLESYAQTVTT